MPAVLRFYRDCLGLPEIGSFSRHEGYSGVMLGLPGTAYHIEFTTHEQGSPCPAPTKDNLLVLYILDSAAFDDLLARFAQFGYKPVKPENPYWKSRGVAFEDPDGWRLVLAFSKGL